MAVGTFREFMASLLPEPEELLLRFELVITDIQILLVELHREASHRLVQAKTGRTRKRGVAFKIDLRFFQVEWNTSSATEAQLQAHLTFIDEKLASPVNTALGALRDKRQQEVVSQMQEFDRNYHAYFGKQFDYDEYATKLTPATLPQEIEARTAVLKALLSKL